MDKQQPEALRLADELESEWIAPYEFDSAAELRRLHQANQELEKDRDDWKESTTIASRLLKIAKEKLAGLETQNQELVEALEEMVLIFTPAAKDSTAANLIDKATSLIAKHKEQE